eukprot:TRINITY_DN26137_c0_g1_i1.p1 TRINITY_DN26137_c0_g1~~TRINITY_DN26137_c0_g1_i1.p1  ORF type:complete len:312 (+),score=82.19 TRINITY_DN26137_c0_g1_i1:85-1020(+)
MVEHGGERQREGCYSTTNACADMMEAVNRRMSQDLRMRVRRLGLFTPLSAEWIEMAGIADHLGQVAAAEARAEAEQRKKGGTVWEREELCVRFVIEEGKTNLILRALVGLREFRERTAKEGRTLPGDLEAVARTFEQGLGLLLRHVLTAAEAVQTIDAPLLVSHCAAVISDAADADALPAELPGCELMQGIMALHYVQLLLERVEQLGSNEQSVMGTVLDTQLVPSVLRHSAKYAHALGEHLNPVYIGLLAALFATEYYAAHADDFIPEGAPRQQLRALQPQAAAMVAAETAGSEQRCRLRLVCDQCTRFS